MLHDKVCESSTSSNRINLSNSLSNNVCIVFLGYGQIIIIIIIIIINIEIASRYVKIKGKKCEIFLMSTKEQLGIVCVILAVSSKHIFKNIFDKAFLKKSISKGYYKISHKQLL